MKSPEYWAEKIAVWQDKRQNGEFFIGQPNAWAMLVNEVKAIQEDAPSSKKDTDKEISPI